MSLLDQPKHTWLTKTELNQILLQKSRIAVRLAGANQSMQCQPVIYWRATQGTLTA